MCPGFTKGFQAEEQYNQVLHLEAITCEEMDVNLEENNREIS